MVVIPYIEEWSRKLDGITALVEMYEKKEFRFETQCIAFAASLEETAKKQGLSLLHELSLIRGEMLKAGRKPPEREESAVNRRKRRENEMLDALGKLDNSVNDFLKKDREAIEESRNLLRQVTAVAVVKHSIAGGQGMQLDADTAMQKMYEDTELLPVLTAAVGKVGKVNCRILIDQVLSEVV